MCVSEKKVCPEGFLGSVSFGEKNVYKFAKQTNEALKNLAALTKGCEIEFPFMPIFFSFFQSSVKGITLNEKLSTFSFFLFHLLFFFLLFNLILCCN